MRICIFLFLIKMIDGSISTIGITYYDIEDKDRSTGLSFCLFRSRLHEISNNNNEVVPSNK